MGIMDWFRKRQPLLDDGPATIPLPSVRDAHLPLWCTSVSVNESGLVAVGIPGEELRINFDNLTRVAIVTTDTGPFVEDVYWLLAGADRTCLIPQGAPGEPELFDQLLKLPNFNYQAMTDAMSCTDNAEFECWRKVD